MRQSKRRKRGDIFLMGGELNRRGSRMQDKHQASQTSRPGSNPWSSESVSLISDIQRVYENLSLEHNPARKVIGVTSSRLGEGTTTVAGLLAIISSERQGRDSNQKSLPGSFDSVLKKQSETLIIDAQFERPTLHEKFGYSLKEGLHELMTNSHAWDSTLKEVSPSLSLITAGRKRVAPLTSTELDKLRSHLGHLRKRFETIIVDLPSPLDRSDAGALSRLCDGLVLVVAAEETPYTVINAAKRQLEESNVPILGAVLNRRKYHIPEKLYQIL